MTLTVFTGGTVIVKAARDGVIIVESAVAFESGRVVALGADAASLGDRVGAEVIDLEGGTLVPGLGEGHAHPVLGGLEAAGPRVRQAENLEGIIAAVGAWRRENPDAEWIVGASYDATFAPGGLFDAHWLDAVTGDTPTILRAWDYHTAWVNSAALAAGGITAETPDPALGRIVRREDGSPLGTLQEAAANDFLADVVPPFPLETRVSAIETATREYSALGMTWVQDAWVEADDVETYCIAAGSGRLHTRVNLAFRADPERWRDQPDEFAALRTRLRDLGHERL
ncbi:MAG: amidohydrolase family protein, partial [Actinobacteria bacterium]|nr:amidohydrolase family protein [Actinomycetota bacterium]